MDGVPWHRRGGVSFSVYSIAKRKRNKKKNGLIFCFAILGEGMLLGTDWELCG
jgi:hypothetical protein